MLNIGVPGCDLDGWIDRVNEFKDFDMIIIDLSINDQVLYVCIYVIMYIIYVCICLHACMLWKT